MFRQWTQYRVAHSTSANPFQVWEQISSLLYRPLIVSARALA